MTAIWTNLNILVALLKLRWDAVLVYLQSHFRRQRSEHPGSLI
jgi:hypothetical protein